MKVIAELFDCPPPAEEEPPRYNVAPSQPVAAIRQVEGGLQLSWLRWGLVPSWAEDLKVGYKLINARAETVATTPAFRTSFRQHRCLIPADGFYEWQKTEAKKKQPYFIAMKDGKPFAFAGLWERWKDAEGKRIESCTIVTTTANEAVKPIHDRMPVILPAADYAKWLDPKPRDPGELVEMLRPYPAEAMTTRAVGLHVNNARFDDPQCLEPA